jgi:predicted Zn-dependent protease
MRQARATAPFEPKLFFIIGSALLLSLLMLAALQGKLHATPAEMSDGRLSATALKLVDRLKFHAAVAVRIDARNERMVSVEVLPDGGYVVSFDESFLKSLTEDETVAALAHELGHVWIFTHHPYLQTEEQANEVALRITDRATLKRVYLKMTTQTGIAANLDEILPPDGKPSD